MVHPLYEEYQIQTEENDVLREELENVRVYIAELQEIERKIEEREEEFDFIASAFPEDHDAPTLFLYLEEKMEENDLNPTADFGEFSVSPHLIDESEHGRIKEVSFNLSFVGEYDDIKRFFREIESVVRIMDIKRTDFSIGDAPGMVMETGEGEGIGVRTNISAYSY